MILLAHICSDQTLSEIPHLSWITLPSPGYMLSCLDKWFTIFLTMWSKLCSLHFSLCITQFWQFLGLGCTAVVLEYIIFNVFLFSSFSYSILSYCLSWSSALSPFHSDDQWWQSCHLLRAACCGSRWAQFPTSHPGQRESGVCRMKCIWTTR